MDKQKLITIAKDQLKGGIGADQVRELLTYRGVEEKDVNAIMEEVLGEASAAAPIAGSDVIKKTDEALAQMEPKTSSEPDYVKKERKLLIGSILLFMLLVIGGSVVYYLYF